MKLVLTQYISLDGVIEDPVGMEGSPLGDWTGPYRRGPRGDAFKHEELMAAGAVLLGRRTYDGFAAVWPQVREPTGYAERINALPKYLASNSRSSGGWADTTVLSGDVPAAVARIKAGGAGDLLVFGSATLGHALLRSGLVDEIRLMVYPVVLGQGRRLFPDGWHGGFCLAEQDRFGDDIAMLRFLAA